MERLRKFLLLMATERSLLIRAVLLLGAIRVGLSLLTFRTLRRLLARVAPARGGFRDPHHCSPEQVARAVTAASHYVPRATCLTQALATQVLLTRRGYPVSLRIGVAKEEGGRLEAHAWVENQGKVVIGGAALERYTPLSAFGGERS
jgi:hypothetical protein